MSNEKTFDISAYFTKELRDSMGKMTVAEMNESLLDLESTQYWIALLKYIAGRQVYTEGILKSVDPVKEPTQIARSQGILMGLSDIVNNVVMLQMNSEREDEQAEGVRAAKLG